MDADLTKALATIVNKHKALRKETEGLLADIDEYKRAKLALEESIKLLTETKAQLTLQTSKLGKIVADARDKFEKECDAELEVIKAREGSVREREESLDEATKTHLKALDDLETSKKALESEHNRNLANLEAREVDLTTQRESLKAESDTLAADRSEFQTRVGKLEIAEAELSSNLELLAARLKEVESREAEVAKAEAVARELIDNAATIREEFASREQSMVKARSEMADKEHSLALETTKLKELETNISLRERRIKDREVMYGI